MAINDETPGSEMVPSGWFRPGISFNNPDIPKAATTVRRIPWFMEQGWKPMPAIIEDAEGSGGFHRIKGLNVAKPYWRRKYKDRVLRRLNHASNEVPTFEEVGLGDSMNIPSAPSTERGFWGNVESLLTSAGSIWQQKEQQKLDQAAARNEVEMKRALSVINAPDPTTIGLVIVAGVLGYYFLSRRT